MPTFPAYGGEKILDTVLVESTREEEPGVVRLNQVFPQLQETSDREFPAKK